MTLLEVCEPLFTDICAINRTAQDQTGDLAFGSVRAKLQNRLDAVERQVQMAGLSDEYRKVRLPLLCFIDGILTQYSIPMSERWKEQTLCAAVGDKSNGQVFFDAVKQAIDDPSPAAEERLEVLYTCLAMGYEGIYAGDPTGLLNEISDIGNRLRQKLQVDERVCGEAYEVTDRRALHLSTLRPITMIGMGCAFLLLVAFLFNGVFYRDRTNALTKQINMNEKNDAQQVQPLNTGEAAKP